MTAQPADPGQDVWPTVPGAPQRQSRSASRVIVIGGGLAGITAAIALAESGAQVTVLEARPRLGGATTSFDRDGLTVDTGQHVFLRCCIAYRGLLARLGMTAHAPIQDRFDVTVLAPARRASGRVEHSRASGSASNDKAASGRVDPRRGRLRRNQLPAPLHLLPALARYKFLNFSERIVVARPALAMRRLDPADPGLDRIRFGDWLAARGQSERARRVLWDLFSVSSLNIPGDDASLALAATVVKTGLLGAKDAADIGVPALPLGELHGDAGARLLRSLGANVQLGAKVAAVEQVLDEAGESSGRFRVRLARPDTGDEGVLDADAVVIAVPPEAAAQIIPQGALPEGTSASWAELGSAPIVNLHVIYDRQVTSLPFAAAVDSPVQWVFDRTKISGLANRPVSANAASTNTDISGNIQLRAGGSAQYLAVSLSAAEPYVDVPAAKLREQFLPALAELFPEARDAEVTEFFVTRERRATFRQAPGSGRLRPKAGTTLPGLALAGAWTDTGWPDTMEGAVRSGLSAAAVLATTRPPAAGVSVGLTEQPRNGVGVHERETGVAGSHAGRPSGAEIAGGVA